MIVTALHPKMTLEQAKGQKWHVILAQTDFMGKALTAVVTLKLRQVNQKAWHNLTLGGHVSVFTIAKFR